MAQLQSNTRIYGFASTDGQLSVGNVTSYASTSNTTGSLIVTGGAGISGNVYANAIYATGLFYAANGNPWVTGGGGGGGVTASGYLANSVIVANSTGYLSNTSNLLFYSSNNTLVIANGISVATSATAANSVYVAGRVGFANNNISVVYQVYNPATNSLDTIFG